MRTEEKAGWCKCVY